MYEELLLAVHDSSRNQFSHRNALARCVRFKDAPFGFPPITLERMEFFETFLHLPMLDLVLIIVLADTDGNSGV